MPEDYDSFDSKQRRKFWENHIEKWKISSLSQRAYCKKKRSHSPSVLRLETAHHAR